MLARTIENLPTLLKNIAVFSRAASDLFGNKRSGDQIGPMLAGAFMLTTTKEVTLETATAWIAKQSWDWHTAAYDDSDASKLVTYIMTARVRYDHLGMNREAAVGDLVSKAHSQTDEHRHEADKALRQYGLRVKDGMLCIANQAPQLRKLLADTPYNPWARTLGDYPSADNMDNKAVYFMAGLTSKAIAIPVDDVLGRDAVDHGEEELPFGAEDIG
jgi:putative DNA primase/helicase